MTRRITVASGSGDIAERRGKTATTRTKTKALACMSWNINNGIKLIVQVMHIARYNIMGQVHHVVQTTKKL